ncbi:MAG: diguanylate cyclase [Pseudomonadota bacterium]
MDSSCIDPLSSLARVLLGTALLLVLLIPPTSAQIDLDEQLRLARQLNATSHWRSGRSILDQIEPELTRASRQQRNRYDLILAHNLALGGASAAGLELIDEILTRNPDPELHLQSLSLAANLAGAERSYRRAFAYLREGMERLPTVDNPAIRSYLLGVAGMLYARTGEIERGIDLARQAVDLVSIARVDVPEASRCVAGQRLSSALEASDQTAATLAASETALSHCLEEGNGHFAAHLESLIGQIHLGRNRWELADAWLQRAQASQQEIGHLNGLMLTRLRLLELSLLRGDSAPPAARLTELIEHLRERRFWDLKVRAHQVAASLAEGNGDYDTALTHLKRQNTALDRLHAWERSRRMAYLEVEFDMDAARQELSLLQQGSRIGALEETASVQRSVSQRALQIGAALLIATLLLMLLQATRERRHYRILSEQDGLTELLKHTRFFEAADELLTRSIASGQPVTLIVGDLDHFKKINDQHGHLTGDTVLRRVAGRMRDLFGPPALLGRIGGEEFAIALAGKALEGTLERIEALRREINRSRHDDPEMSVSMSFGVACFDGSETMEQLRGRADAALYQAKQSGRNRVVLADAR